MNEKSVKESSVVLSHVLMPQDANPGGIAHGGVVMKLIDDAAAVAALRHTRNVCVTASIDRLDFHKWIGTKLILKKL